MEELRCCLDFRSVENVGIFVKLDVAEQVESVSSIPVRATSDFRRDYDTRGGFVIVLYLQIDVGVADSRCRLILSCFFRGLFDRPCFRCDGLPSSVSIIILITLQVWGRFSQVDVFSSTEPYLASDCSQQTACSCVLPRSQRVRLPPASACNQGRCSSHP